MSIRESTKYAFANALKQLLTTKDLQKIRVTELCKLCGAERPTFYYHFRFQMELTSSVLLKMAAGCVKITIKNMYFKRLIRNAPQD